MADTIEEAIAGVLYARTVSLAVALQMPLSWPGFNFSKPASGAYLEGRHFPNTTIRRGMQSNGYHEHLGMLQVNVWHKAGTGEQTVRALAADVVAHFPCDLKLVDGDVTVRIMKRPEARELMTQDTGIMIPVMIDYQTLK
jgi:hypothetical protein